MPAPIALYYITLVTYLWLRLCVYAEDNPPLAARANVSSDTADARSPFGRVPPYQAPGSGPVGGSIALPPIYRPHNAYTRVEGWYPRVIGDKESYVVADQLDDHDDEHGCNQPCYANQFSCQISCTCIPMDKRCDDVTDCAEAEDEAGCLRECDQSKNRTFCHGTNVCISTKWICDGDNDCGDFSDETNCGGQVNCSTDEFTCANGLCIHSQWVCDGDNDCRDNSDETNCTSGRCAKNQFTCGMGECIAQHWRCDKEPDCQDNSDEIDCPLELILCGDHEFQCENKKCIEKAYECDGDNDCGDWSDEDTCPMLPGSCNAGEFKCNDGKCIPERWRCDSEHDCADGGDELNCGTRDFRNCTEEEYTCADKRCILKTWTCDGVRDCTNGEDEQSCEISCEADQYLCKAPANPDDLKTSAIRYCVNRKHVCDGQADCPDGDDEEKCPKIRPCYSADKCKHQCITTWDSRPGCTCPFGYLVAEDGFSCVDIDECMYEQDPVCSQTCSNTVGSYACGCMTGYVLRPDKKSCKPLGEPPTLLFSNRVGIRQVWLTGDNYMSVVKGLHNAIALDYHYEKKLVFWSENNLRVIRVAQTNNNNMTDVIKWGLETPSGLAVDWIHDLLFWTDSGTRRVEVATLDGRLRTVLAANDLDKPRAIAVHPGDALVFWTDWGPHPKIERSDMDGNRRKGIIISDIFWPNGLTIDYVESFIYWADAKHHVIERAGFDGEKRKRVTTKGLPHPFALTLFEEAIYWTDWHTKSISSLNKNTGKGIQTVHAGLNVPMDIRSFHSSRQLTSYKNRCGKNNGGCSHLCLPNRNGYTCRCPVGYSLSTNRHTCEDTPEQLLVYARSKDLRLKQLDARNQIDSIDMVIPVQNIKSAMALDWDFKTKTIFWTDVGTDTINRAYLNGSHQTAIVRTNLMSPAGIAYDWVNNKIYWTDAGTNRIEVANTDGSMRSLLAWTDIDKPRDIVVSPIDGVMYWTDWGANPCIEKADMNGDNRKRLISGNMTWPNGLALDFVSHRIYWTDGGNKTIEYADFYGYNRTILIHLGTHPFGLDVFGEEIFWTDWESQSLQAASKWTGKNRRTLGAGSPGLMDVRVFHKYRFPGYPPSCAKNNGGCSHLCLLKPHGNTACACPIGIKLGKDGKTCINGPVNYLVFAHRVDIRVVSLDVPYMIDVVLPVPPLKHALGVDVDLKTGYIYWSDTGERKIQRADIHGKGFETVIEKALTTVDGIAIDSAGRKIYWTDGGRNSIEVGDLNGENRKVLVWTTLDSPRAIALHYEQGYMFWSDWGAKAKIERADMDGRYRRVIVDNNIKWPNGLAIDKADGRLYWNDAKILTIESSDFNGNHRRTILSGVPYPYGIVIVGPHIYWTDWKTKSLHKANKTNGSDQVVLRDNLDGPMDIRAVHGAPVSPNACGDNNGGCSHLCLRNPHGYTCACPTGLNFKNLTETNPKECQDHPENFLFFASRGGLVTISLDSPELWDVHLPKNICQNPIAVDFHWGERLLFFTDVNYDVIRSINMNNMSETKDVINTNLETPNGLAVDWIANNIYWTDNDNKVIEVARLDGTSRKVLLRNLSDPRAIALFPAKGYIFWGGWDKTATIERAYLDGSHRQVIVENDCDFSTGITIDFARRRLYWIDSIKHLVETSDLEGRNRVVLFKLTDGYNPFGMTEYQDSIYWTDWQKRAILTPGKIIRKVPEITVVRADLEMPMEIKTVSPTKQRGWNPCMEDNGGCSHLCLFRLKDYICACPDVKDGRPCAEAAARPVGKMPPGYPFTDYLDEESDETATSTTKPEAISDLSGVYISIGMTVTLCLISIIVIVVILRMNRRRRGEMKENYREASGHISFHNPNYAGAVPGEPGERRPHRLQGIFKYDKSQERVTNMYIPEGTSLLPAPPPPPPHRAPPRPATHDDFEPVTLHPFV